MGKQKGLVRSKSNRMIAGVCGGLAERFGISAAAMRALFVVFSIVSAAFPGILVYIVLWIVMPEE